MISTVTFYNDMESSIKLAHVGSSNSGQVRLTPDIDLSVKNDGLIKLDEHKSNAQGYFHH